MYTPCNYRSAVTCPYCKYRYKDPWEPPEAAEAEGECESCGKNFYFSTYTEVLYSTTPDCVLYSTTPDCVLNGKQHEYVGTDGVIECSVCGHLEEVTTSY